MIRAAVITLSSGSVELDTDKHTNTRQHTHVIVYADILWPGIGSMNERATLDAANGTCSNTERANLVQRGKRRQDTGILKK